MNRLLFLTLMTLSSWISAQIVVDPLKKIKKKLT